MDEWKNKPVNVSMCVCLQGNNDSLLCMCMYNWIKKCDCCCQFAECAICKDNFQFSGNADVLRKWLLHELMTRFYYI